MLYTTLMQMKTTLFSYWRTQLFRYERFYKLLISVLRLEERDTNFYYADHAMLTIPNARRILLSLRSLSVEICETPTQRQLYLQRPKSNSQLNGRIPNYSTPWSNVNFQLPLFQNTQILRTISSGYTHSKKRVLKTIHHN